MAEESTCMAVFVVTLGLIDLIHSQDRSFYAYHYLQSTCVMFKNKLTDLIYLCFQNLSSLC